jgi:hypothetical protein avisC_11520
MTAFQPFHSAVNRIPVLRPKVLDLVDRKALPADLFGDQKPPAHDHLLLERWSGAIDLELTVRTPLVYGEQRENPGGGTQVEIPTDQQGRVVFPGTMVKGMLSRAYEVLTASRFRVFEEHAKPLTYRADVADALRLVPVRVVEVKDKDGGIIVELLRGSTGDGEAEYKDQFDHRPFPIMLAASLQDGGRGHAERGREFNEIQFRAMTRHENKVRCDLALCLHPRGGHYAYWQVVGLYDGRGNPVCAFDVRNDIDVVDERNDVTGYVYRTARDGDQASDVFPRKHDERVFFDLSESPERLEVDRSVVEAYRGVVDSYAQQREENDLQPGMRPNRFTGVDSESLLHVGALAYAVLSDDETAVEELVPTMAGRRSYCLSPRSLAEEQRVAPLGAAAEASAADRLFGYVVPDTREGAEDGDVAARGRLIFGQVDTSSVVLSREETPIAPLLSPKPASARRFLTDRNGRTPRNAGEVLRRSEYFRSGQHLGVAVHPIHRSILGSEEFPASATRAPRQEGVTQGENLQIQSVVKTWIRPGSVLRCRMRFENLSRNELAALVWLLEPANLVPASEQNAEKSKTGYLRVGLGKPLGLGAVEVRMAKDGLRAVNVGGENDLSEAYQNLSGCLGVSETVHRPTDFVLKINPAALPWVQALQRASFGYSDGRPVRHMLLNENQENNKVDRYGDPKCGLSPVDMFGAGETKLLQVPEPERRNGGRQHRRGRQGGHHGNTHHHGRRH